MEIGTVCSHNFDQNYLELGGGGHAALCLKQLKCIMHFAKHANASVTSSLVTNHPIFGLVA
jgi:hypothetical protein